MVKIFQFYYKISLKIILMLGEHFEGLTIVHVTCTCHIWFPWYTCYICVIMFPQLLHMLHLHVIPDSLNCYTCYIYMLHQVPLLQMLHLHVISGSLATNVTSTCYIRYVKGVHRQDILSDV